VRLGAAYAVLGAVNAGRASRRNGANPVLTFAAMATMHASYGIGFIAGAIQEFRRRS
jgi:hypothetical protein